jgi:hypothetical protein
MARRKGQTKKKNDPQNTAQKKKIEQHNPSKNRGRTPMLRKGKQFLLH